MSTAIEAATSFAHALQPPVTPASMVPFFDANGTIYEHLPFPSSQPAADFIGKEFKGKADIERYFNLLAHDVVAEKLVVDNWWVVEPEKTVNGGKQKEVLGAKGEGTWKALKTGKRWAEEFIWKFEMMNTSQKHPEWTIHRWEVFADPEVLAKAMDGEINEQECLSKPSRMGRELATKAGMKVPEGKGSVKK